MQASVSVSVEHYDVKYHRVATIRQELREIIGESPLSLAQQSLWADAILNDDDARYNVPLLLSVSGPLDLTLLERALQKVITEHAMLRANIVISNDNPEMMIRKRKLCRIQRQPYTDDAQLEQAMLTYKNAPFDLANDTLLRCVTFQNGSEHHKLLFVFHHIIIDGLSTLLFLQSLWQQYNALLSGKPRNAIVVSESYLTYIDREQQYCESADYQSDKVFWQSLLHDTYPGIPFESSHHTNRGLHKTMQLSQSMTAALDAVARSNQTTLFSTLLSSLAHTLTTLTGNQKLSMLIPSSQRSRADDSAIIGLYTMPFILPIEVLPQNTIVALAQSLTTKLSLCLEHNRFPYLESIKLSKQPSSALTFPSFNFQNWSDENSGVEKIKTLLREAGLQLQQSKPIIQSGVANLAFNVLNTPEGLKIYIDVQENVVSRDTLEKIAQDWHSTLTRLGNSQHSVSERIIEQAKRTPHNNAVTHKDNSMTYEALITKAQARAAFFQEHGIGKNRFVIVYLNRGIDYITTVLAIWLAGATYVPVDPHQPTHKKARNISLFSNEYIVVCDETVASLGEIDTPHTIVNIDAANCKSPLDYTLVELAEHDLAYVLFTSGSTGNPKAVMVEHTGMLNHFDTKKADFDIDEGDKVAQTASQVFDISVWQMMMPLTVGATTVVFSNEDSWDPDDFLPAIEKHHITILELVPTFLRAILAQITPDNEGNYFSTLRYLLLSGEALTPDLCQQWFDHYPNIALSNGYGPSECSDRAGQRTIRSPAEIDPSWHTVPITPAIAGVQLHVLDDDMNTVSKGETGEIYISGVNVGRGYFNNPDLTAKVFITSSVDNKPPIRLYRTGDVGRLLSNGDIEYLDRADRQVKVNGVRIEMGEVEAALNKHPQIYQAAVIAEEKSNKNHLHAFITLTHASSLTEGEIRAHCARELAPQAIPSHISIVDAIATMASGKIDRQSLAAKEDKVLSNLKAAWAATLQCFPEKLDHNSHFFELGGDSISSIQLASKLKKRGYPVKASQIMANKTLAEQLNLLQGASTSTNTAKPQTTIQHLGPMQHWFFDFEFKQPNQWCQRLAFKANQPLRENIVELAAQQLCMTHLALTQKFPADDTSLNKTHRITRVFPGAVSLESASQKLLHDINIQQGALFKIGLIESAHQQNIVFVIHHLVVDSVSWRILMDDFIQCYQAFAASRLPQLAPEETSYLDWLAAIRSVEYQKQCQEHTAFFAQLNQHHFDNWRHRGD